MTDRTTIIDCSAPPPAPAREHERRHVARIAVIDDAPPPAYDLDPYRSDDAWRPSRLEGVRRVLRALGLL